MTLPPPSDPGGQRTDHARLARNPGSTAHLARVNNSPVAGRRSGGRFGAQPPQGPRAGPNRWSRAGRSARPAYRRDHSRHHVLGRHARLRRRRRTRPGGRPARLEWQPGSLLCARWPATSAAQLLSSRRSSIGRLRKPQVHPRSLTTCRPTSAAGTSAVRSRLTSGGRVLLSKYPLGVYRDGGST